MTLASYAAGIAPEPTVPRVAWNLSSAARARPAVREPPGSPRVSGGKTDVVGADSPTPPPGCDPDELAPDTTDRQLSVDRGMYESRSGGAVRDLPAPPRESICGATGALWQSTLLRR